MSNGKCGYSFWGFLGDVKYDKNMNVLSTPDGNAFYSWCIIRELQRRDYDVVQIMPDRDKYGYEKFNSMLFSSWHSFSRNIAYRNTKKLDWEGLFERLWTISKTDAEKFMDVRAEITKFLMYECADLDFILHEYRMEIPSRNTLDCYGNDCWQPDYLIQECLFQYCALEHKKLIIFDLDYKLTEEKCDELNSMGVDFSIFELGEKWQHSSPCYADISRKVYIPFDFSMPMIPLRLPRDRTKTLVYVGNRYERDWCIDKYIPEGLANCVVYGNWLEGNRDSKDRWPNITFGKRLQTADMYSVYSTSVATILLAKKEYCENGFMTARVIESIFYGTVPLFIEEYGEDVIEKYAGIFAPLLTVRSKEDVEKVILMLMTEDGGEWCTNIINYMRNRLHFMHVGFFVDELLLEVK